MHKIEHNNITWLDISFTESKKIETIDQELHLHPFVARALPVPIKRPRIEEYDDYIFIVLHFPVFDKKTRKTNAVELDFLVSRDKIISIHPQEIPALKIFFDDCNVQDYLKKQYFKGAGILLLSILDKLIDSCLPMLDHIQDNIDKIEAQVFGGKEKEMLNEIALVKRDLINFRRSIKPQRSVLEILAKKAKRFFANELTHLAQEVVGSNIRVWNTLENHKEMISAIEETNNSLLSYKLSAIVQILTVVSFITFPLAVIAGLFGMNVFENIGFVKSPNAFWIILAASFTIALTMVWYFKRKKWL